MKKSSAKTRVTGATYGHVVLISTADENFSTKVITSQVSVCYRDISSNLGFPERYKSAQADMYGENS